MRNILILDNRCAKIFTMSGVDSSKYSKLNDIDTVYQLEDTTIRCTVELIRNMIKDVIINIDVDENKFQVMHVNLSNNMV